MTRRQEIISTLLEWYEDVLNSWHDGRGNGDYGYPMCNAVYNHPSYRELERLLVELRSTDPAVYWNVAQRYLYAPTKVVLRCSSCGPKPDKPEAALLHPLDEPQPPFGVERFHRHGWNVVTLRPQKVRAPSLAIDPRLVAAGISWLDEHWVGEPFVPDFEAKAA